MAPPARLSSTYGPKGLCRKPCPVGSIRAFRGSITVNHLVPVQQAYQSRIQELPKFVHRQACLTQH
jgi:hypothetical protein